MPSRSLYPRLSAAAFFLLFLFGGPFGFCLAAESITIDVGSVYASNSGNRIDVSLVHIQDRLGRMFDYSSYKLLDRKLQKLSVGERKEFELPGARSMRIRLISVEGKKVRLYVRIEEKGKKLLGTTLGLSRGGLVLVGGPVYESGVLIFLISAD
ncbi:MAG: hypothetical protein FWH25_01125 [Syntrophorhabdaceae bacterium]|nr:hypothetical protein [Syntrophorhabdaceae bacterium]